MKSPNLKCFMYFLGGYVPSLNFLRLYDDLMRFQLSFNADFVFENGKKMVRNLKMVSKF